MYFPGVNTSNIAVSLGASYNWSLGLTAEAWVYYTSFVGSTVDISAVPRPCMLGAFTPSSPGSSAWALGSDPNGKLTFYYYGNTGGTNQSANTNISLSLNTWNHVAVSVPSGGPLSLYINGIQQTSNANNNGSRTAPSATTIALVGSPFSTYNYLGLGSFSTAFTTGYIADARVTYGAALYTGASFTVPSAPLAIAASGTTVMLARAGQNSPTVQNGALTFDRGLKQFMNFGPRTFNVVTQGFTAVWRGAFTGTVASYERLFEFGPANTNTGACISVIRGNVANNLIFYIFPTTSSTQYYVTTTNFLTQGTNYVIAFRYNPATQISDIWVNGVQNARGTITTANIVADRTVAFTYLSRSSDSAQNGQFTSNTLAIYNRALSNVEIINAYSALTTSTTNAPIEIGDANGTPALSIASDGRLNMQRIGQTSAVTAWPPAAMTGYVTVINGGTYVASASSEYDPATTAPWLAFNKTTATSWTSLGTYNTSSPYNYTGTATTTDVNGTVYPGEWVQIQLPVQIVFSSYFLQGSGNAYPSKFVILGSRDGVNWVLIDSRSNFVNSSTVSLASPVQSFNFFRLVAQIDAGYSLIVVQEWTLYGTADTQQPLEIAQPTTMTYPLIAPQLTGPQSAGVYVPQDFSSSGLNIPAYIVGSVPGSAMGPFAGEGSVYFSGGTGAYISFPSSVPSLNYDIFTSDFTIEGWIYNALGDGNQNTILNRTTPGNYGDWVIFQQGVNMRFEINQATIGINQGNAPYNQWFHFAITMANSTIRAFVNGATENPSGTAKTTTSYTSTGAVNVGTWTHLASGKFIGNISNLRIIRGAALYTATFTPPTGPLQPIQGVTQAGTPYGTVLLLRNAPAPGRVLTQKFAGANSGQVLAFPPAAMTGYATVLNSGYGQGTYVASASGEYSGSTPAWCGFDKTTTNTWFSLGSYGAGSPYVYTGSVTTVDINGTSYKGEWLQIQLASSLILSSYSLSAGSSNSNFPSVFVILGSRDGTNWFLVDSRSGQGQPAVGATVSFSLASSQAFTYFRIVVLNVQPSNGGYTQIAEWTLNGTIESVNVTADGRVGLGVVNPTRALEVAGDLVVSGTVSGGNPTTFRNALMNGNFDVWQRGTSFTASATYTADRFQQSYNGTGSTRTITRETFPPGQTDVPNNPKYFFRHAQTVAGTGATYNTICMQHIEGVQTFAGQVITLSLWARASVGTPFINPALRQSFGVSGSTSVDSGVLFAPVLGTTWKYYTWQFVVPNIIGKTIGANDFLGLYIYTNVNTIITLDLAQIQLEQGTVATPFEVRPFATELALCQRYYWRLNGGSPIGTVGAYTTLSGYCPITFPVPMRAAGAALGCNTATPPPAAGTTITLSNSDVSVYYSGTSQIATSIRNSSTYTSTTGGEIFIVWPTAVTLNGGYLVEVPIGKFIEFSAEL
jgi:hypothetical protein